METVSVWAQYGYADTLTSLTTSERKEVEAGLAGARSDSATITAEAPALWPDDETAPAIAKEILDSLTLTKEQLSYNAPYE
jgi:hypothetical protein